jgi:hypothetical protein
MSRCYDIDYSKWNNLEDSGDDSDTDDIRRHRPQVTRFDEPRSVTIQSSVSTSNGENTGIVTQDQRTDGTRAGGFATADSNSLKIQDEKTNTEAKRKHEERASREISRNDEIETYPIPKWIEKGGISSIPRSSFHLSECDSEKTIPIYWGQDRSTVTVRISINELLVIKECPDVIEKPSKLAFECSVSNLVPYEDRLHAVGIEGQPQKLSIDYTGKSKIRLIELTVGYPIYLPVDEDDVDWFLESPGDGNERYLSFILYKATPMAGLTLWWKKPFKECNEDIAMDWQDSTNKNSFQMAWNEAHEKFLENRKTKKYTPNEI